MITQIMTTNFTIRNRVADDKPSVARACLPFDVGDEVLIIPYTIGTIIQRMNEKHFLIETDSLNVRERPVNPYNDSDKGEVRYPRFREDKVIICKYDEMPYTEFVVDDFEIAFVQKVYSSVVKVNKEDKDYYHTAILYDEKLTKVKKQDDGLFRVMSYSPSIVSEYPMKRANRFVLNVPNDWLAKEVILVKW